MTDTESLMENSPLLLREGQYVNAGQSLFTIYKTGDLLAEFSIPPSLANAVKAGTSLLIQSNDTDKVFKGKIGLIEPVLKNGEYFSLARVYLSNTDFRPGQLVKANVPVFIKEGWWVPKKAVWQSGIASIVFKKENGVFVPKNVKTEVMLDGEIQLLDDISDWEIASNAYYLVDSESFIRPQNTKE
jgi:multidrug efflux pump subunit AcrA (membrane-fusion protein)